MVEAPLTLLQVQMEGRRRHAVGDEDVRVRRRIYGREELKAAGADYLIEHLGELRKVMEGLGG